MTSYDRVAIASRVFSLAAVGGLALALGNTEVLPSLVLVAFVAFAAAYISLTTLVPRTIVLGIEAVVITMAIGIELPSGATLLPYFLVIPFLAGVTSGIAGIAIINSVQLVSILLVIFTWPSQVDSGELFEIVAPWMVTSCLAGFVGAWIRANRSPQQASAEQESYALARRLLEQLRGVTKHLTVGLDAPLMAHQVAALVGDTLASRDVAVYLRSASLDTLSPIAFLSESSRRLPVTSPPVQNCLDTARPTTWSLPDSSEVIIALPLRAATQAVGVVLASTTAAISTSRVEGLMTEIHGHALRIEAAVAFDEIRESATAEERRRLAREIHDGVAQELASLGYAVDALLAEGSDGTASLRGLSDLRAEISRVVNELRLSIFDLRSEVLSASGLGAALSELVRRVGSTSPLSVHLTLDESPRRLRPEVEAELLRITGEAINNARRHSDAKNLWVKCLVDPPYAAIEVRDDGRGIAPRARESYGLRTMEERAQRLNATLEVLSPPPENGVGTLVSLRLDVSRNEDRKVG